MIFRHSMADIGDVMSMKMGLGIGNFLTASLPQMIDLAARHGFETVTVRPMAVLQALEAGETQATLRRRFTDAGIRPTLLDGLSGALPDVPPPESMDPAVRALLPIDALHPPDEEACFRCAELLQLPVINVIHYRGPELPLEQMADAVGALCRRAKARGLVISLEFVPTTGLRNLPFTQAVIAASGASNCGITLDFFHLDRTGGTAADIRKLPRGSIVNIQVSDRTPAPPGTPYKPLTGRKLPGEGQLPLRELMTAALENSPDATIDIEVLNEELRAMPMDEAAARLAAAGNALIATL
jgi:sugar phosphate isomerase/epimerase